MKLKDKISEFKTKHEKGLKVGKEIAKTVGSAIVGGAIGYVVGLKTGLLSSGGEDLVTDVTEAAAEVVENIVE